MFKILNIGHFAAIEEKAFAKLGKARVLEAYASNGVNAEDKRIFNLGVANKRYEVLEKLDPSLSVELANLRANTGGSSLKEFLDKAGVLIGETNGEPISLNTFLAGVGPLVGDHSGKALSLNDFLAKVGPLIGETSKAPTLNQFLAKADRLFAAKTAAATPPPLPGKTAAQIASEVIGTGKMPEGFETWSRPKQLELVQALIPLADARTKADLRLIEAQLSVPTTSAKSAPTPPMTNTITPPPSKQSAAPAPTPPPPAALDLETLKALHTHVFGEQSTNLASYDTDRAGLTHKLACRFYHGGLRVPGLDTTSAAALGQPKEATGIERVHRANNQKKVDEFFKAREEAKNPKPAPQVAPLSETELRNLATEVLGASSIAYNDTYQSIAKKFYQAHLEVPGLDYSAFKDAHRIDASRIKGFSKTVLCGQQDRINKFFAKRG